MSFAAQQITVFNKILLSFLKDIRKKDGEVKQTLKENYKIFDKRSDEYIVFVRSQMSEGVLRAIQESEDLFESEDVLSMCVFRGVTIGDILEKVVGGNRDDERVVKLYVYMLLTILYFDEIEMEDNERSLLLTKTFRLLNGEKIDMEEILDDTILKIMSRVEALREPSSTAAEGLPGLENGLEFMRNTKIGELAEEITRTIDLGDLTKEDMMSPEKLFSGDNNVLSGIIQSVGSTIQTKLDKGELNQQELLNEAMSMMGNLKNSGHGDMMADVFKMMSSMTPDADALKGGVVPLPGKARNATHARLRKKIANNNE